MKNEIFFNLFAFAIVGIIFSFFVGIFYKLKDKSIKAKINWWIFVLTVLWCLAGLVYLVESCFWSIVAIVIAALIVCCSYKNSKKFDWLTKYWLHH